MCTSKVRKFPIPLPNATILNILIVKARMLGKHFVAHMTVTGVNRMELINSVVGYDQ